MLPFDLFGRLKRLQSGGKIVERRRTDLVSIARAANALESIAEALRIVVLREYGVDVAAPPPTRADLNVNLFDPMYPDEITEAARDHVEAMGRIEREMRAESAYGKSESELSEQEKQFLHALHEDEEEP